MRVRARSLSLSRAALGAVALLAGAPAVPARAGDDPAAPPAGPSLTVYSSADPAGFDPTRFIAQQRQGYNASAAWQVPGYAVVKEERDVDIAAGTSELSFTDVAEFIDPTTVSFSDLTPPASTTVLEQAFRFDLASPDKILERYVDKTIAHETSKDGVVVGRVEGKVLSVNQGTVVLQTSDGLRFLPSRDAGLRLPALPSGLLTKPTLVWRVASDAAGRHRIRTTYQTAGLTWRADYNMVLNADSTRADLGAWVTLLNLSGASYPNARLKLIAGDVQKVTPQEPPSSSGGSPMGGFRKSREGTGFEEKAFFEYHLYTLPRRTDVPSNATQQITLFPTARDAAVERVLVYYGLPEAARWGFAPSPRTDKDIRSSANPKVDVYIRLKNEKANRLGMPLPKGKVRVYQRDEADGTLEFVGEDLIDHTPKDETVLVKTGQAFDVVGDRVQTTFSVDSSGHVLTESFKITIKNHKTTPVKVIVKENLFRWLNWEILQTSEPYVKIDARTIHFEPTIDPDQERTVAYTVRYTW